MEKIINTHWLPLQKIQQLNSDLSYMKHTQDMYKLDQQDLQAVKTKVTFKF